MAIVGLSANQSTGIKMGLLETLHEEHKARQQRIADAAIRPPENSPVRKISDLKKEMVTYKLKPSLDIILHELCRYYGMHPIDVLSKRRSAKIAVRRQILMFLADRLTVMTNPQIAGKLDRDPSTVRHAIAKITINIAVFQKEIDELEDLVREAFKRENIPCQARKT